MGLVTCDISLDKNGAAVLVYSTFVREMNKGIYQYMYGINIY
jgi:hypothetical protein